MANRRRNAANTRRLLGSLAALPGAEVAPGWVDSLREVTEMIRCYLAEADRLRAETVAAETLYRWRTDLDRSLAEMERINLDLWSLWRRPGTWLDSVLRLRSILCHVVGKAYWDDQAEVRYADIDMERYLWGAR